MRQINLLPEDLQKAQYQKLIMSSALIAAGSTFLVISAIHLLMSVGVASLENKVQHPPAYIDTIEFVQLREQIQGLNEKVRKSASQSNTIIDAYMNNDSTVAILRIIGDISKYKVWLTRFALNNKTKTCEIEGKSFNTRLVSEFMLGIKKTSFFDSVTPVSMEKGPDEKINFKIACTMQ